MLNTIYTNASFNQKIFNNIKKTAEKSITPKQIKWLQSAMKDYCITVSNIEGLTCAEASIKITKISLAIANKSLKPRVVAEVKNIYYVVIHIENQIRIKTFIGDYKTAFTKALDVYGEDNCKFITPDVEEAKIKALYYQRELDSAPVSSKSNIISSLHELEVDDLKILAKEYKIKLGRASKKETIIRLFEEQLAC